MALASAAVFYVLDGLAASPALALTVSGATVIALTPVFWRPGTALVQLATWCLVVTVLALGLALIAAPVSAAAVARTGLVVLLVAAIVQAPLWLLAVKAARVTAASCRAGGQEAAIGPGRILLMTVLLTLAAAPVWLGPTAAVLGEGSAAGAVALAVSPLVQLAVAADADLLRTPWFYSHSLLGSVRFSYPDYAYVVLGDAAVAVAVWLGVLRIATVGHSRARTFV
ncbi:MAG: hypothetical protein JSR67_11170 [Proteobacteria bacterium]|nr:hypothetical protein [Pseudomonadota bacterium]